MIKQLSVGGFDRNFSYVAWDDISREGFVVDPCGDITLIFKTLSEYQVALRYVINTHGHGDHISGNHEILRGNNAALIIHSKDSSAVSDISNRQEVDGGERFSLGNSSLELIHTPGHTPGSMCIRFDGGLFTGDTLFIDWCGYAQNKQALFDSLQQVVRQLPDDLIVYPGHNYGKTQTATLSHEKKHNPYLQEQDYEMFCERYLEL